MFDFFFIFFPPHVLLGLFMLPNEMVLVQVGTQLCPFANHGKWLLKVLISHY